MLVPNIEIGEWCPIENDGENQYIFKLDKKKYHITKNKDTMIMLEQIFKLRFLIENISNNDIDWDEFSLGL